MVYLLKNNPNVPNHQPEYVPESTPKHMHVHAVTPKKMLTQKKTSTQLHIYAEDVLRVTFFHQTAGELVFALPVFGQSASW